GNTFKIKLDTGAGSTTTPNGLSTPVMIDPDGDQVVDFAYAGDLYGNLWRFDLRDSNPSNWTAKLLFVARDSSAKAQPITSKPQVIRHPNGGLVILFGTGRYLGATDVTNTDPQTFYGVWDIHPDDPATPATTITRANLQQQTITVTGTTFRVSSANNVCWAGDTCTDSSGNPYTGTSQGWYIDLPGLTGQAAERVVSDQLLIGPEIVFTSIAPNNDPCEFGGTSWLNILDAVTGKRVDASFVTLSGGTGNQPITATPVGIQVTENGQTVTAAPTSAQFNTIMSAPTKMDAAYAINIYATTAEGKVQIAHLSAAGLAGRLSWRQLEFVQ
ncbi:MAG: hypothetical protein JNJ76_10215, partial [Candidatus Competibacter sp.]|nr:hypothetical protein [Candidatus Competibacter sp.]